MNSLNFARYLKQKHGDEREIRTIFAVSNKSKQIICQEITLLRNQGNLEGALTDHIVPKKRKTNEELPITELEIWKCCNGFYRKRSLSRHVKKCFAKPINETWAP